MVKSPATPRANPYAQEEENHAVVSMIAKIPL